MAIPSVKLLSNEPGGAVLNALNAINSAANNMHLRKINQVKSQYAPQLTEADINSKNAYATLVGLQPAGKILANVNAYSSLPDAQQDAIKAIFLQASGLGNRGFQANQNNNAMNQMPHPTGVGQPGTNSISGKLVNWLMHFLHKNPNTQQQEKMNALNIPSAQSNPEQPTNPMNMTVNTGNALRQDNINHDADTAFINWMNTPEGQRALENKKIELTASETPSQENLTNAEKTGQYLGTIEQGKKAGGYRAEAEKDIGQAQLGLSNSGAALNKMVSILKNPEFENARAKIPFFQDKQLGFLEKTGGEKLQKLIGQFITASESIISSGVQAFGGRPLATEFALLQRQKVTRNDTVSVAMGKMQASIDLHDIMEEKNNIIGDLLKKGFSEADAVKKANKMVDISEIEKRTEDLLRDKPNEEDINYMAKKRNMSPEQMRAILKQKGIL